MCNVRYNPLLCNTLQWKLHVFCALHNIFMNIQKYLPRSLLSKGVSALVTIMQPLLELG